MKVGSLFRKPHTLVASAFSDLLYAVVRPSFRILPLTRAPQSLLGFRCWAVELQISGRCGRC